MSDVRTQRRRPTIAKDWQLAVLKRLQSESENPTEEQRLAVVAETGLDEKWIRNWFTRQRSKLAARNRKDVLPVSNAQTPTFKLRLYSPSFTPSRASTPLDPTSSNPRHQASPVTSPRPSLLVSSDDPPAISHTTRIPPYSRDPLRNRYPDFSQFFRPRGPQRLQPLDSSMSISGHDQLVQLLANSDLDSHTSLHFQGFSDLLIPPQLNSFVVNPNSSTYPQPCPVAISMRLVDLLGRH